MLFLRKLCCLEAGQFAQIPLKYAALQRLFKWRISKVLAGRSIRTFAIKNLSRPSYQGFCFGWTIGGLICVIAYKKESFQRNNTTILEALQQPKQCQLLVYSTVTFLCVLENRSAESLLQE